MSMFKHERHSMDPDLSNGNGIIINMHKKPTGNDLLSEMIEKFNILQKNQMNTHEEKLFFICITLNLLLYFNELKNEKKRAAFYLKFMSDHYQTINNNAFPLQPCQKEKWNTLLGNSYQKVKHFEAAIPCYEMAVKYRNKIEQQKDNPSISLKIQTYKVTLIELNLKLGYRYLYLNPVYGLAKDRLEQALLLCDEMLKIETEVTSKITYYKARVLTYLGEIAVKEEQFTYALSFFVNALLSDISGLAIVKSQKARKDFVQHMLECCNLVINNINLTNYSGNNNQCITDLTTLRNLISEPKENFDSVKAKSILNNLFAKTKPTPLPTAPSFWQTEIKTPSNNVQISNQFEQKINQFNTVTN